MSERGSFISQYIYNDADYRAVRSALDLKDKYLCIAPPATWKNEFGEEFEMPIVSGKVGEMVPGMESFVVADALSAVNVNALVKFVVICDNGDIDVVKLYPPGETDCRVEVIKLCETNDDRVRWSWI